MKETFWKANNCAKETELIELCKKIISGGEKLSIREMAEIIGTTPDALKRKKSSLGLITDPRAKNRGIHVKEVAKTEKEESPKPNVEMPGLDALEQKVILYLKKRPRSVGDISREIDKSKESVIKILDSIRAKNYDVKFDKEAHLAVLERFPHEIKETLELEPLYRNHWRFGIIGDSHIGSIAQQTTLLNTCYKIGEEAKIDTMFHAGDMLDGVGLYRGQDQEIWLHGADDQENWVVNNWPYTKKFKTYCIAGSHDTIFKKRIGHNALKAICKKREDIVFRGEVSADFVYHNKNIRVNLIHPSGGLSYSVSYNPQKIVENVASAVMAKIRATNDSSLIPHIFIFGHFHRTLWMPYMGTQIFLSPCLQGQTPYLAQKGWSPVIGMLIVQIDFDDTGNITNVMHQFRDFSHIAKDHDY